MPLLIYEFIRGGGNIMKKIVAILVVGLLMAIFLSYVGASIDKIDEKEKITKYESRIYGFG
jgi:hypothetical protein